MPPDLQLGIQATGPAFSIGQSPEHPQVVGVPTAGKKKALGAWVYNVPVRQERLFELSSLIGLTRERPEGGLYLRHQQEGRG